MRFPRLRPAWLVGCVAVAVWSSTSTSYALCDWLCSWLQPRGSAVTTYTPPFSSRPVAAAPAVAAPTMCSYVPQIAYRTVYRPVPVTTCQAVTACDPCTGCAVTTFRPVTAYTYQAQLVPCTTYRMVCSTPSAPYAPAASACAPYVGLGTSAAVGGAGCATCAPSSPTLSPSPTSPAPWSAPPTLPGPVAPSSASGAGSTSILSGGAPSASGSTQPGTATGTTPPAGTPTYAPGPGGTPPAAPVSPYAPKPSGSSGGSLYGPGLRLRTLPGAVPSSTTPSSVPLTPASPASPGRTAARPVVQASYALPVSLPGPTTQRPLDLGGWQPVR
ncbi:MAG: hypothetical protein NUV77_10485 [Thermoguttaceae bacterium]|nr:hypothetical protein [Thermoguttaceae bacterium]